jgi:acetylornithine aminotransferase
MILGIPFREPQYPAELMKMARERGVLILTAGKDAVRLVPSLNISKGDVDVALDVIESCLGEMHQR